MKIVKYEDSSKKVFINLIFSKEDLETIKNPWEYFSNLYKQEIGDIDFSLRELTINEDYGEILKFYNKEDIGSKELFFAISYKGNDHYNKNIDQVEDLIKQMYDHFLIKKYLCE